MLTTLPTGRRAGSDAATPVRATTPDAVVVPLQYAVAVKSWREPAAGRVGSTTPGGASLRESDMLISYANTKPTLATSVTMSLRPTDREMTRPISGSAQTPRAVVSLQPESAPSGAGPW